MRYLFTLPLIFSSLLVFAQHQTLSLASDIWPPFSDETGEKGFALALVNEGLQRAGVEKNTEVVEFTGALQGMKQGDFDGSAALWKTKEREDYLLFSQPYLENRLVLVGRKGADVSAQSLSELKGKKIAIVGSYAYGERVDSINGVEWFRGYNDQANLEALLSGEVDYMLVDDLVIYYVFDHQGDEAEKNLEVGNQALVSRGLHFVIRKDVPNSEHIIESFNREILEMVADGSYHRILDLNWIRTDVDGDGQTELVLRGDRAGHEPPKGAYQVNLNNSTLMSRSPEQQETYHIGGNNYQGWGNVPDQYKIAPLSQPSPHSGGVKLKF